MIERELISNWNSVMYPTPEPEPDTYGQEMVAQMNEQVPGDEQPGFGNVSLGEFTKGVAGTAAAGVKGAVQGFVGLPGDLEEIGRLLVNLVGGDVDEESFLATTDDIKKILDKVVPKTGLTERGQMVTETIGELASPGGYLKGVKAATKAATARKAAKRSVAVGGSSATIKQSQQEPN
jgi:hypothetical protein